MEQSDKLFNAFLRLVIRDLKEAIAEEDPTKRQTVLKSLLADLQTTLED